MCPSIPSKPGEWLTYTIEAAQDGPCGIDLRASSVGAGATLRVEFDDRDVTGHIVLPMTGSGRPSRTKGRACPRDGR